jgi:mannosyltransferase
MTGDEAFAWAAAAQPVSRLLQLQPMLDSGKLAIYDLMLHYWISIFGDSLRSMRSLSAGIDTISILLMFAVVREVYKAFGEESLKLGDLAGGFAALLFATNVAIIESGRTARMYPLMTMATLAEMVFFVRAQRRGQLSDSILTACFLALAIAANFTAALILISQVFWLAYLVLARYKRLPGGNLHVTGAALSLVCGLMLLLPWRRAAKSLLREEVRNRDFGWILYQPPLHWFYEVLRSSLSNEWIFVLVLALAAFAIWRNRSSKAVLVPMFMSASLVGPFVGVITASLFHVPMMVDRYVLLAVAAFLGLAAIGAASLESRYTQLVVFGLIVCSAKLIKPPTVDWRWAARIAAAAPSTNKKIGVTPVFALDVILYNLPAERRAFAVPLKSQCGDPEVLIVSPGSISEQFMSMLKECYPRLLGKDQFLEIRARRRST